MIEFLLEVKWKREKSKGKRIASKTIKGFEGRYRKIPKIGMQANTSLAESPGKKKRRWPLYTISRLLLTTT